MPDPIRHLIQKNRLFSGWQAYFPSPIQNFGLISGWDGYLIRNVASLLRIIILQHNALYFERQGTEVPGVVANFQVG